MSPLSASHLLRGGTCDWAHIGAPRNEIEEVEHLFHVLTPAPDEELVLQPGKLQIDMLRAHALKLPYRIARAFLAKPSTIAQRLVRAKARLKEGLVLEVPSSGAVADRMPSMLRTIYLLFNEGYAASGGEQLVRREFCEEAIRLCRILLSHAQTSTPEVHASPSCLHGSKAK